MSGRERDLPARYLRIIARLLPATRRQWGEAMRAELATLDRPSERLRFALSCTRLAVPSVQSRSLRRPVAVAAAAGLVLAGEIALARAIGQVVPLILVLALLAWLGRRPGYFGPVRPDRAARAARAGGYLIVGSCLLALAAAHGASGLLRPHHSLRGPAALLLTLLAAAFLAMTARGTRIGGDGLIAGLGAGLIAGLAGFAVLPFERIGTPLADGLPGHGQWLAAGVFGAPVVAAALTGRRTRRADQAVMAALCAGAFAALLIALLGLSAITLLPGHVPDIVGPFMPAGATPAQRQFEDVIEASDPYFGLLAFGASLTAVLWVMARPPIRATATVALLFLLGLPGILLAATAKDFPGSELIESAALALVIGAIVTTRPSPPRVLVDHGDAALS